MLGESQDKWSPRVTHGSNIFDNGDFKRVFYPEVLLELLRIAIPKELVLFIALRALVIRHVFDYGNCRDFELVKHLNTLDHIDIGQLLRGRHNNCSVKVNFLRKGKLDVTCTWREIYDEVV